LRKAVQHKNKIVAYFVTQLRHSPAMVGAIFIQFYRGGVMAYEKSKGVCAIATGYSGGSYSYTKLDPFIGADTYKSTPDRAQDLDSYRNADGVLKRHVLKHTASGITFNTPYLYYRQKVKLMKAINDGANVKDGKCVPRPERKVRLRYYNDLTDDYSTGYFYIPDIEFTYYSLYGGEPMYLPITIEFIEY